MSLKNKTAVIFGGSGAIGSAAAYALAREGATVYLAARDQASWSMSLTAFTPLAGQPGCLFSMLSMPTRRSRTLPGLISS